MAEYIKTEDAIPYLTKYIPSVEAVEYSEYEALKKENHELAIKYDNAMNRVADGIEEISRLRSKIDKALEQTYKVREMVLHSNRTYEANDVLDIIDEISACFERHIGE